MHTKRRALLEILVAAAITVAIGWWIHAGTGDESTPLPQDDVTREDAPRDPRLVGAPRPEARPDTPEDHEAWYGPDVEDDGGPVVYELVARDLGSDEPIPNLRVRLETSALDESREQHVTTDEKGRLSVPISSLSGVHSETEGWTAVPYSLPKVAAEHVLYFHRWFDVVGHVEWRGSDPPDLREIRVRLADAEAGRHVPDGPDESGWFRVRVPWAHPYTIKAFHPEAHPVRTEIALPLTPDQVVEVRLVLKRRVRPVLTGVARDRAGAPMKEVLIHAHMSTRRHPPDRGRTLRIPPVDGRLRVVKIETPFHKVSPRWMSAKVATDDEGRFRFSLPGAGAVELTAFAVGHEPVRWGTVDVAESGRTVEILVDRPHPNAPRLAFTRDGRRLHPVGVVVTELVQGDARRGLVLKTYEDKTPGVDTTWLEIGRRYRFGLDVPGSAPGHEPVTVIWKGQTEIALDDPP